jgi:hypothetical protein
MSMTALFVGWGNPVRGRELKALQLFDEAMKYYSGLKQQGEIESFEAVVLEPHGGDLSGFLLVKGDAEKLMRLRTSDEFITLTARSQLLLENVGVTGAFIGEGLQALMGQYASNVQTLS